MDLLIGQHDSIVEIVYLDNRELVDIISDTLEIVACSLLECRLSEKLQGTDCVKFSSQFRS